MVSMPATIASVDSGQGRSAGVTGLGQDPISADDAGGCVVSVLAERLTQKFVEQCRCFGVEVADADTVAVEAKDSGWQVGPIGTQI